MQDRVRSLAERPSFASSDARLRRTVLVLLAILAAVTIALRFYTA
jgi:hypothetical protein